MRSKLTRLNLVLIVVLLVAAAFGVPEAHQPAAPDFAGMLP